MTAQLGINQIGRFDFSPLIAGDYPKAAVVVTLKAGQTYKFGSVLGYETATGLCTLVDSAATDGTEKPYAVLAGSNRGVVEDVDATDADEIGVAYATGEFAREFLIFGVATLGRRTSAPRATCACSSAKPRLRRMNNGEGV